jgi:hypothetical protein
MYNSIRRSPSTSTAAALTSSLGLGPGLDAGLGAGRTDPDRRLQTCTDRDGFSRAEVGRDRTRQTEETGTQVSSAWWPGVDLTRFFVSSSALGVVETTIFYPLDLIRVRLQASATNQSNAISAFWQAGTKVVEERGWCGLFRGNTFSTAVGIPLSFLYIGSYNCALAQLESLQGRTDRILGQMPCFVLPAIAGALAESVSCLGNVPVDIITMKLQLGECPHGGALAVSQGILAADGVPGFFKGISAHMYSNVPSGVIWWCTFEAIKAQFHPKADDARSASRSHDDPLSAVNAFAGAMAGITAASITNPLDVAKTRIQTGRLVHGSSSVLKVLHTAMKSEGPGVMTKGLLSRIAIAVPSSVIMGLSYEFIMKFSQVEVA